MALITTLNCPDLSWDQILSLNKVGVKRLVDLTLDPKDKVMSAGMMTAAVS